MTTRIETAAVQQYRVVKQFDSYSVLWRESFLTREVAINEAQKSAEDDGVPCVVLHVLCIVERIKQRAPENNLQTSFRL